MPKSHSCKEIPTLYSVAKITRVLCGPSVLVDIIYQKEEDDKVLLDPLH
ncbi:hypothetical protein Thal_0193 [Thermocrinis albus DSM 14484]|uniref:Uncharacterized protein n=1 Tax=Thermocrinis albus (strain DSM 14484 / JCM 11386 / HI 11/12) TaxID=638303 RepID=D3SNU1_THEAH|nr:hypothetical protein [Thermocrinis albus]ADC88828.1 hypothetical protein Thal_0193 [Thermocrinis albus DSM 14484]